MLFFQIRAAVDDKSIESIFEDDDYSGLLLETGYHIKPTVADNREELIQVLSYYHTLVKAKAEIDQFLSGLQCIGFHEILRENPEVLRPLFVHTETRPLTAGNTFSILAKLMSNAI